MKTQNDTDSAKQAEQAGQLRPALIASHRTIDEYSGILRYLLVGLADESVPTALIVPSDRDVSRLVPPSVEVIKYPALDIGLLWWQNRNILLGQLEKFKPSVLHCLCRSKAQFVRWLSRRLNLSYVLSINSLQRKWDFISVSSRRCARIIVPAESIVADFKDAHPRLSRRLEKVNAGIFVQDRPKSFADRSRVVTIMTVNRFADTGEFKNLLGAARHLAVDGYEFVLVIVSVDDGSQRDLWKQVADIGLSEMVTMVPLLEPQRSVLAACDIFVEPWPSESFEPLLLEAMSVGTVVAGCKGGVDDLIIENETAAVFDPADELSVYHCLKRLLDGPDLAGELAQKAQNYLKENHTVSAMIESMLRIYRETQAEPASTENAE